MLYKTMKEEISEKTITSRTKSCAVSEVVFHQCLLIYVVSAAALKVVWEAAQPSTMNTHKTCLVIRPVVSVPRQICLVTLHMVSLCYLLTASLNWYYEWSMKRSAYHAQSLYCSDCSLSGQLVGHIVDPEDPTTSDPSPWTFCIRWRKSKYVNVKTNENILAFSNL